jgi:hypothetical protein
MKGQRWSLTLHPCDTKTELCRSQVVKLNALCYTRTTVHLICQDTQLTSRLAASGTHGIRREGKDPVNGDPSVPIRDA